MKSPLIFQEARPVKNAPGGSVDVCRVRTVRHQTGKESSVSRNRSSLRRNFRSAYSHNLPRNGMVLPQPGFKTDDVAKGQADVLQGLFGDLKSPAKTMARETGLSERACRNHLAGLNAMNLADFFNACHAMPELRQWGARMMGMRANNDPDFEEEFQSGRREILLRFERDGVRMFTPGKDDDA